MHQHLDLLLAMTEREIKARYKLAVLGFLWIVLNPVLQMLVIGGVFAFVLRLSIQSYFPFLFTGLLAWNFFSITITKLTPAIVFELHLIEKANFPREVIVLSIVLSNLFHAVIGFLAFAVLLLLLGQLSLVKLLVLPLPLLLLTACVTGLGFLTSALNVRYRDVNFFVQALVPLWFYATPILYRSEIFPQNLQLLFWLNPLTSSIEMLRWIFVNDRWPDFPTLGLNIIIIVIFLLVGSIFFHREAKYFDDWV